MLGFTERVIKIIQGIPEGQVMTYGQVAACAGSPRGARQVVRILHSMSKKYHLPWHRVINARGELSLPDDEQVQMQKLFLQSEGVEFDRDRCIDLSRYRFHPETPPDEFG